MTKKFGVVAIALLSLAILGLTSAQAQVLLTAYDYDSNTGTAAGDSALDVSGNGTSLDGVLQGSSSLVVDATRPGAAAGNLVLSTGVVGIGAYGPDAARLDTGANGLTYVGWIKTAVEADLTWGAIQGRGSQATRVFMIQDDAGDGHANLATSNGNNAPGAFQYANLTPKMNDGNWNHFAIVFDPANNNIRGYRNGVLGTSGVPEWQADNPLGLYGPIGGNDTTGQGPITSLLGRSNGFDVAGRSEDNGDRLPNVLLDDNAMFSGVLSDSDIKFLADGGSISNFKVPEPTSLGLAGLGLLGLLLKRRRS